MQFCLKSGSIRVDVLGLLEQQQGWLVQRLTIERLASLILFILLFALAIQVPIDTDTWWHLRSGEKTLHDGAILREDIFSFTQNGKDWINHSWGAQIILYGLYKLTGGTDDPASSGTIGLALYTATLATLSMFLIYRMCAGNVYSRMFVMVLGAATAAVFWSPRPQMVSFLFGTITLYLLYLFRYKQVDRLWLLPALMVLWVNFHAGFAIGFIILFGFIAGEGLQWLLDRDDALTLADFRRLAIVTVVAILALSLNPFGPRMMLYPFDTAGIQVLNLFIQEWRSPDFKNPQTWPFIAMVGLLMMLAGRTSAKPRYSDLALAAGTAALALWSARNISLFAIVATPLLSRFVENWLQERNWVITPTQTITPRMAQLNAVILALVAFAALAQMGNTLAPDSVKELQEEYLPVAATHYIQENQPPGPMFNDYNWGGYFIFTLPNYPVFVDGRTDLYGDDFLTDYIRALLGAEEWRDVLDDNNINLVVIQEATALATLLRESPETWQLLYEDDLAIIFGRVTERE